MTFVLAALFAIVGIVLAMRVAVSGTPSRVTVMTPAPAVSETASAIMNGGAPTREAATPAPIGSSNVPMLITDGALTRRIVVETPQSYEWAQGEAEAREQEIRKDVERFAHRALATLGLSSADQRALATEMSDAMALFFVPDYEKWISYRRERGLEVDEADKVRRHYSSRAFVLEGQEFDLGSAGVRVIYRNGASVGPEKLSGSRSGVTARGAMRLLADPASANLSLVEFVVPCKMRAYDGNAYEGRLGIQFGKSKESPSWLVLRIVKYDVPMSAIITTPIF